MKRWLLILFLVPHFLIAQVGGILSKKTLNQRFGTGRAFLVGSDSYDIGGVLESTIVADSAAFNIIKVYYTGNDVSGHTTVCLLITDTNFTTITKIGPVVGNGKVVPWYANGSVVVKSAGVYYMYATNGYASGDVYIYTSTNGYVFTYSSQINKSVIPGLLAFGNQDLLKDSVSTPVKVGSKYRLYTEGNEGFQWMMYVLESDSLLGTWTFVQKLTTLQVGTGSYSGSCATLLNGIVRMFYHYSTAGTIPTYGGYATSIDGLTFTQNEIPFKALEAKPYGIHTDQSADFWVQQVGTKTVMLAEYGQNSPTFNFSLYIWFYNGSIKKLVTGLNDCLGCPGVYP